MTQEQKNKILEIISNEYYSVYEERIDINVDDSLYDDLYFDSLDIVTIELEIEKAFRLSSNTVTFYEDDGHRVRTVADLLCYVDKCLHRRN